LKRAGCREGHELRDLDVRPRGCDGLIGRLSGGGHYAEPPLPSLSGKTSAPSWGGRKRDHALSGLIAQEGSVRRIEGD